MLVSTNHAAPRIPSPAYAQSLWPPYVMRGAAPLGNGTDATETVGFAAVFPVVGLGGGVGGPRRTAPQAGHISAVDGTAAPQLLQRISQPPSVTPSRPNARSQLPGQFRDCLQTFG
jgi:hypothetical protein